MPVRFAPFDAEPLGACNYVATPSGIRGCAVGANGTVLTTADGGASWAAARSSGTVADLYSCVFVDDLHGWAGGEHGVIVRTEDGGVNWHKQESGTTEELDAVEFTDLRHGVITGARGTALRTDDGGETWVDERR